MLKSDRFFQKRGSALSRLKNICGLRSRPIMGRAVNKSESPLRRWIRVNECAERFACHRRTMSRRGELPMILPVYFALLKANPGPTRPPEGKDDCRRSWSDFPEGRTRTMKGFILGFAAVVLAGVFFIALALAFYEAARFLRKHLPLHGKADQDKR